MTRNLIASCILSVAFVSAGSAQAADHDANTGKQITQAELKQLTQEAHSPDQYKTLAGYYGEEHAKYQRLATEEKKEWDRRSQSVMGVTAKYPRPVDSARYLYEYYSYKASESELLEAKYSKLASPGARVFAQ